MADLIVSGAGSTQFNGTYTDLGLDLNNNRYWEFSGTTYRIQYDYGYLQWILYDFDFGDVYYGEGTLSNTTDPVNSNGAVWSNFNATDPAPSVEYVVTGPPTIVSISPTHGVDGDIVTITGTSLTGTTSVSFNGLSATFNNVNSTKVTATVPTGVTTGTVSLTTAEGTATGPTFTVVVLAAPITGTTVVPRAWYKADSLSLSNNAAVTNLPDSSGRLNHATHTLSPNTPTFITNLLDGKPGIRLDGSSSLKLPFNFTGGNGLTWFVVTKGSEYNSLIRFQGNPSTTGSSTSNYVSYGWSNPSIFIVSDDGTTNSNIQLRLSTSNWNMGVARWKRNTVNGHQTFKNGQVATQRNSADVSLTSGMEGNIGVLNNEGSLIEYSTCDFCEIIIYDTALSDSERVAVEDYLRAKYPSIPVAAPPAQYEVTGTNSGYLDGTYTEDGESNGKPRYIGISSITGAQLYLEWSSYYGQWTLYDDYGYDFITHPTSTDNTPPEIDWSNADVNVHLVGSAEPTIENLPTGPLVYSSAGDTNGVFYYIGTQGLTTTWSNPHDSKRIKVSLVNSSGAGVHGGRRLVDRDTTYAHTTGPQDYPWIQVDLKGRALTLNHFSFRQRIESEETQPTSLRIEGSNNGFNWSTIHTQTGLATGVGVWNNFAVSSSTPYALFRFVSLSNTANPGYTCLGEVELYGTLSLGSLPLIPKPAVNTLIDYSKPISQGLVLSLPFNEGSGTTVNDAANNPTDGTASNSSIWKTDSFYGPFANFASLRNIVVPHSTKISTETFTISFSFKTTQYIGFDVNGGYGTFANKYEYNNNSTDTSTFNLHTGYPNLDNLFFQSYNIIDGVNETISAPLPQIRDGMWHRCVITRKVGDVSRYYFDGVLVAVGTNTLPVGSTLNTAPITLGNDPSFSRPFIGGIGHFHFWNRELTGAPANINEVPTGEIASIFSNEFLMYEGVVSPPIVTSNGPQKWPLMRNIRLSSKITGQLFP